MENKYYSITCFGVFEDYDLFIQEYPKAHNQIIISICPDCDNLKPYNPLENKSNHLFNEISKLNIKDGPSIIDFCKKFGILAPRYPFLEKNSLLPYPSLENFNKPSDNILDSTTWYSTIELDDFKRQIKEFQNAQKLSKAIKIVCDIESNFKDGRAPKNQLIEYRDAKDTLKYYADKFEEEYSGKENRGILNFNPSIGLPEYIKWKHLECLSFLEKAKGYLEILINNNRYGYNERLGAIAFFSPIDVVWWQLKKRLENKYQLKQCEFCGDVFIPTHGLQKYCHPYPGQKRSSCQNNYSQKTYRAKAKLNNTKIDSTSII